MMQNIDGQDAGEQPINHTKQSLTCRLGTLISPLSNLFYYRHAIRPIWQHVFKKQPIVFNSELELIDYYLLRLRELIGEHVELTMGDGGTYISSLRDAIDFYVCTKGGAEVTTFCLRQLPGCCAFVVSYHVSVSSQFRNKGVGKLMNAFRLDIARFLRYTAMLCTDKLDNGPQRSILHKNGFVDIYTCINKKTDNHIAISLITL